MGVHYGQKLTLDIQGLLTNEKFSLEQQVSMSFVDTALFRPEDISPEWLQAIRKWREDYTRQVKSVIHRPNYDRLKNDLLFILGGILYESRHSSKNAGSSRQSY